MARSDQKVTHSIDMNLRLITFLFLTLTTLSHSKLTSLQQIDVKTFEKMREVERYQIKIAEKHFEKSEKSFIFLP